MEAIISQTPIESQATISKLTPRKRPHVALDPDAIYSRREAAQVARVSESTLVRAYQSGHLPAHTVGNRIRHFGWQLLEWLNAGGRTTA